MDNYIINSFIFNQSNSFDNIFLYVKRFYSNLSNEILYNNINVLIKKKLVLVINNSYYKLTDEGIIVMKDNKYYYYNIIYNFICNFIKNTSRLNKKYILKEIRCEQQKMRNYLIENTPNICVICEKKLPICLLETAHIKPRCLLNKHEINDTNNIIFMCRYCHKLYDNGYIGINNNKLCISDYLNKNNYDLNFNLHNTYIGNKYFDFHYKYIFV